MTRNNYMGVFGHFREVTSHLLVTIHAGVAIGGEETVVLLHAEWLALAIV